MSRRRVLFGAAAIAVLVAGASAFVMARRRWGPPDPGRGEVVFGQRCALCHAKTAAAGQGPGLGGIVGRRAASARFGYSRALRTSGLTWDAATLDRFLAEPGALVPGTTMPLAIPDARERRDVVAFLATLPAPPPEQQAEPPPDRVDGPFADFRGDAPGTRRRFAVEDLPRPFSTTSAENGPDVVDPPPGVHPRVPPGFVVARFADGFDEPRVVRRAPDGDLFVSETAAGRVRVIRTKDGADAPERVETFAEGLRGPFGVAFYPPGSDPRWVYVASVRSVVRFPYRNGDLRARGAPETIVGDLPAGGHSTRDVAFSKDGARMFVSVGSASNVQEGVRALPPDELRAWEEAHGRGAAWGDEARRADVLVFDPEGKNERVFASGIRNCVGLAIEPTTGDPWCATNERDGLGDDLVPDYVTRVREGAFYGWPWLYLGDHEDPRHRGERPDLLGHVAMPDVLIQPHSAPLEMTFYDGASFPAEYRGDAFVALHGSWNRSRRTGYKVVRVLAKEGVPTGEYEDFLTGFVVDFGHVWGRPVGVAVANDGALVVTEDGNGTLWRVAWEGP